MKKFQLKKPDIKGKIRKIRNLKKEDVIAYWKGRHERRERILEARRNSAFAKKMQPVYAFMNRFSLIFHALLACIINFTIEAISRHSLAAAWNYMTGTPLVFLYNAFMIFVTFSIVYLFKRRIFVRIIISALWIILGIANGYILLKRVTPFNAQDLKIAGDGIALINNYCNGFEVVVIAIGAAALVVWLVSMWRRGGQYTGKVHHVASLLGIVVCCILYTFVTNAAIDKRVVSTYFGNIAFAYEDYGLPYCFSASLFNTGISEPNGYTKKKMAKINKNEELNKSTTSRSSDELPNIIVVQLESYFDVANAEFFTTSEDACPNLHNLYQNYSSGYFKVPSVGAGTANTEFEVLTGMNLRYFGPGEYPYKTYSKKHPTESAATALAALGYGTHALHDNTGNFYSRANVFNNMGFDTFTSKEFMNVLQTTENGWAKDEILTQHIMEAMDTSDQEDFVFTVSVQGHGNYPETQLIENPKIKVEGIEDEALKNKWEYYVNQRDGLALGICNGFQALIKLGLVPGGKITGQLPDSPTLTYNTIGRHISKMVYTKVVTNKSPWLREAELGGVYTNPASHGEGRFVANKEWLDRLFANGQVATQYCDPEGNITMDEEWNVNGSYCAIEGITSPDGRVLGKMAHSERRNRSVAMNIYGEQDMKIFESGVKYFK